MIRGDATHLMNFIPSALNNEAVKDYFNDIDWYSDSLRPKSENIKLGNRKIKVELKGNERKSIPVSYTLIKPCIYSGTVKVNVITEEKRFSYDQRLSGIFKGRTGRFSGKTEEHWVICNGQYTLSLSKRTNGVEFQRADFNCEITLSSRNNAFSPVSKRYSKSQGIRHQCVLNVGNSDIINESSIEQEIEVYSVNN